MNKLSKRPIISYDQSNQQEGSFLKQVQLRTNLFQMSNTINTKNDVQQQIIIYHYSIKIIPSTCIRVKKLLWQARELLQNVYGRNFISNQEIYSFKKVEENQKIYIEIENIIYCLKIFYRREIELNLTESNQINQNKTLQKKISSLAIQSISAIYKSVYKQFQKDILKQTGLAKNDCKQLDHYNFQCFFREQINYRANLNEAILSDQNLSSLLKDVKNQKNVEDIILGKYVRMKHQLNKLYQIQRIDYTKNPLSTFYCAKYKQNMTFQKYYKERYNLEIIDLNQPLFVVNIKKQSIQPIDQHIKYQEIYLIPEFCLIFFQLKPQKFNKIKQIQVNLRQKIYYLKFLQKLQHETGIQISKESCTVNAYALNPPKLIFQKNKKFIDLKNSKTNFNISNQILSNISFKEWIFIYPKSDANLCLQLSQQIQEQGQVLGIRIPQPTMIQMKRHNLSDGINLLENYFLVNQVPQFILSYVNFNHPRQQTFYQELKLYLYATVAIEHQHFNDDFSCHKNKNAAISSLIIQIASKLGYPLWQTHIPNQIFNKTMIIAIAVEQKTLHLNKQQQMIAVVTTISKDFTQMHSEIFFNEIQNGPISILSKIILSSIKNYVLNTKQLPDQIIIYRQGLIEPSLQIEKESIINGFRLFKEDYQPKFAYFCVSQSKKQQIFSQSDQKMDITGSVIPLVQNNQVKFEFFLCSKIIQEGFSIPTRYSCLYDDTLISQEQHWQFTYYQCFNYFNFQGALKIPAQLKYACKLLKFRKYVMEIDPSKDLKQSFYYI
ncbi:piwi domain protein (macronuclear) [Tetrahymena thermophila SB210]|uniref:Piwi domain protein n=2 Tax=Tetrahymena thermophila TaxID=5911 RepID=Q24HU6_TETTS|nr:piwi domain protein [Tetrahymena thermophila SB210]ABP68415.1 Twi10p [Tetrahymena thermophila]EAS07341.2 piwi domain protein [Tetrahymena thermophila SB210]|eukprot:XP_001027583.2 piwi domain protein [Tetrahymena thermophila SB210]